MVTLFISKLSDNLGFDGEDLNLKSVSAAWNKVREIRDTTDPQLLNGTLLEVGSDNSTDFKRIPHCILFKLNNKGKIEFKDQSKLKN